MIGWNGHTSDGKTINSTSGKEIKELTFFVNANRRNSSYSVCLGILSNISLDWKNIFKSAQIWTLNHEDLKIDGENISWSLAPLYPSCQQLILSDFFNMSDKNNTPLQIFFQFRIVENLGVSVLIEESNKAVSRPLKSSMLIYSG